jgi:hypothetical protein
LGQNPQMDPNNPANLNYIYGEQNPEASFTRRLADLGYGGTDPESAYMRSQFGKAQSGYGAAKQTNLALNWQDYLKSLDFDRMWMDQSARLKGYNDPNFAPPTRWMQRA